MKIGLFGYGKMGKMIEGLARGRGHEIRARIDAPGDPAPFGELDVAIDFSSPGAAFDNITRCLEAGVPVVSGTTGWLDRYDAICRKCEATGGAFIYASNFSLGVNLFFSLNEYLAGLMSGQDAYSASIDETHHTEKVDAPSGTAITLAEGILERTAYTGWSSGPGNAGELPVHSHREGTVPGTHRVCYESAVDRLEITHSAHNREGFALGALVAAEWLIGKKGVFTMKDVLNLR